MCGSTGSANEGSCSVTTRVHSCHRTLENAKRNMALAGQSTPASSPSWMIHSFSSLKRPSISSAVRMQKPLFPVRETTLDYSENRDSPPYDVYGAQKQDLAQEPSVSALQIRPPPLRSVQPSSIGGRAEGWPKSPLMLQRHTNDLSNR